MRFMLARAAARQTPIPVFPQNADSNLLFGEVMCATGEHAVGLPHLPKVERPQRVRLGPHRPELAPLRALTGVCTFSASLRKQAEEFAAQARQAFDARPKVCPHFKT
jgi:hypothetical protein